MISATDNNIWSIWQRLLQLIKLARNSHRVYLVQGLAPGSILKNPFLEKLLPSLSLLHLVSLFENAIEQQMEICRWHLPKGMKKDLCNQIDFMKEKKSVMNASALHGLRKKRNKVAHELKLIKWSDLDDAINTVEIELQNWNMVRKRPQFEFFAEKSGVRDSDKPGFRYEEDTEFGLTLRGKKVFIHKTTLGWG